MATDRRIKNETAFSERVAQEKEKAKLAVAEQAIIDAENQHNNKCKIQIRH